LGKLGFLFFTNALGLLYKQSSTKKISGAVVFIIRVLTTLTHVINKFWGNSEEQHFSDAM